MVSDNSSILKERIDIIDSILKELYSDQSEYTNVDIWCERHLNVTDYKLVDGIIDELIENGIVEPKNHNKWSVTISPKVSHLVKDYHSYKLYVKEMEQKRQPRTTNILAENVQYNEGSNYGNQSQSSSKTVKPVTHNTETDRNIKTWLKWIFLIIGAIASIATVYQVVTGAN